MPHLYAQQTQLTFFVDPNFTLNQAGNDERNAMKGLPFVRAAHPLARNANGRHQETCLIVVSRSTANQGIKT